MSVQRSPPRSQPLDVPVATVHYNSDSALNTVGIKNSDDNYFNSTKRQKRTFGDLTEQPMSSFDELKFMFLEIKTQQDEKFDLLSNSMITIMNQNQEIQKSVVNIGSQYEDLQLKVTNLEQENCQYKKRVLSLEKKLDQLEKNARCTTIEIRNLPKLENESKSTLATAVQNLGKKLGLETVVHELEIKEIYRSKSEALVVDFTTTKRKESIIATFRKLNKARRSNGEPQLSSEHILLPGPPRTLFISEYLSSKARRVFYVAREHVKNKNLAAAWTSFGKVYVKKEETAVPVRIEEESELLPLVM